MPTNKSISDNQLKKAMMAARKQFGHRSDVTGCDIGYKWEGETPTNKLCVRVHVRQKIPLAELEAAEIFPPEIEGVPLDVIQGPYRVQRATSAGEHRARNPQLMGGISCGRMTAETGTIGAIVADNATGQPALLSNWHVLHGPFGQPGDSILQPGRIDGGVPASDAVATLGPSILDADGDAAVAPLSGARPWMPLIFGLFSAPGKVRDSRLGETLVKSGRTTAQTRAKVDGEGFYKVLYDVAPNRREVREIRGFKLVTLKAGNPDNLELSSSGDSGALWVNPNSGDTVGLHFAGEENDNPTAEFALACNLTSVLKRLDVRLATFEDLQRFSPGPSAHPHSRFESEIGLTPVPPGVVPGNPFPPTGPQPPIGPLPPVGPWPVPIPPRPPQPTICACCGGPMIYGRGHAPLADLGLAGAERAIPQRIQISRSTYIWPTLKQALVAKNANFSSAQLFDLVEKFFFTASGGQFHLVVKDAVERSATFIADGVTVPFALFFGAPDFWTICSRIGDRYPTDRFEVVN